MRIFIQLITICKQFQEFFNEFLAGLDFFLSIGIEEEINILTYLQKKSTTMKYYMSKILDDSFENAIEKVTAALKEEGFGVLTDIDISATLKKKLDVDYKPYRILGACNPHFAYQALQSEDKIGSMLPCNVIVQENQGQIEVSAVDPMASMQAVENEALAELAAQVRAKLEKVIASI